MKLKKRIIALILVIVLGIIAALLPKDKNIFNFILSWGQKGGVTTGGPVYIGNQINNNYPEDKKENKEKISDLPLLIEQGDRVTIARYYTVHNIGVRIVLINKNEQIELVKFFKYGIYKENKLIDGDNCNVQAPKLLDIDKAITSIDTPISLKFNEPYSINLVQQIPSQKIFPGKYQSKISVYLTNGSQIDSTFNFEITKENFDSINVGQIAQVKIDK